jgi:phosphoglycolate phosphatase
MIKCVVFDFDGTLVESNEIKRRVFYEVTKDIAGAEPVLDKLFSIPDSGDRYDIFNLLIKNLGSGQGSGDSAESLSNLYTKICEHKISEAPEVSGASSTLIELKKIRVKMFVSSATPTNTLQRIISMRGWSELFDGVMGSPDSKECHLRSILFSNHYSLSEVAYIGDSEIDQEAASLIGCKFIGIGKNWRRFDSRPAVLLNTLEKLIKELKL